MPPESRISVNFKTEEAKNETNKGEYAYSNKKTKNVLSRDLISFDEIKCIKHPLVESSIINEDDIKIPQQMALYCITKNGGSCDEQMILKFFENYYWFINVENLKITRKYIRDVLSTNINNVKLFKSIPRDKTRWMISSKPTEKELSTSTTSQISEIEGIYSSEKEEMSKSESEEHIGQADHSFQDKIYELIKESEYGLTIQEINKQAKAFETLPGSYQNLPLDRRVKASLRNKIKDITYDANTMLWTSTECKKNFNEKRKENIDKYYPEIFKSVDMPKLSVSELYGILKKEGIMS